MTTFKLRTRRTGFTLVELMVVIAIIGLLIAVLLPSFGAIRNSAKKTATLAQLQSLETGLEMLRGEASLGSTFPPSATDNRTDRRLISNPISGGSGDVQVTGAHLLYHALVGFDGLGTPGFVDIDRDGFWWNDTSADINGAYYVDPATGEIGRPRYGAGAYVDDKMRARSATLGSLLEEGVIQDWSGSSESGAPIDVPLFIDTWDQPILYYRANRAATLLMGDGAGTPGVYRQEDNSLITGSTAATPYTATGIDLGPGQLTPLARHGIGVAVYPTAVPTLIGGVNEILSNTTYESSMARYILDGSIRARNTPVRKSSYLLISAGPDAFYGTDDDIVNWTRGRE